MKILILQGHPDGANRHFCHALAEAYRKGAQAAGHHVNEIDIGKIDLPTLRDPKVWKDPATLDFVDQAQAAITEAEHIVLIFPLWMGTLPAHLKAWLEWVFTEAFAFQITAHGWTPKLRGRSARIVITMGMPGLAYRYFFFAHSLRMLRRNMLGFAGLGPIRDSIVGSVEDPDP